ncbi:hypothetical protein GCM10023350_45440 [Nocardioides endophyticus]|uniref:Uncharacterized protein n=1 Tax=Nocardioides endophyticus TaxID=1353775 RepID=A0ABP8ZET9_9ACTN
MRCDSKDREGARAAYGYRYINYKHGPLGSAGSSWESLSVKAGDGWMSSLIHLMQCADYKLT